jgi:hypothetical protein
MRESSGWKNARFFRNAADEILVCSTTWGDDCGNVYTIYQPGAGEYSDRGVSVCTR